MAHLYRAAWVLPIASRPIPTAGWRSNGGADGRGLRRPAARDPRRRRPRRRRDPARPRQRAHPPRAVVDARPGTAGRVDARLGGAPDGAAAHGRAPSPSSRSARPCARCAPPARRSSATSATPSRPRSAPRQRPGGGVFHELLGFSAPAPGDMIATVRAQLEALTPVAWRPARHRCRTRRTRSRPSCFAPSRRASGDRADERAPGRVRRGAPVPARRHGGVARAAGGSSACGTTAGSRPGADRSSTSSASACWDRACSRCTASQFDGHRSGAARLGRRHGRDLSAQQPLDRRRRAAGRRVLPLWRARGDRHRQPRQRRRTSTSSPNWPKSHRLAPAIPASRLLESATRSGAEALGFAADYGTIEPGKRADLIAVRLPGAIERCGRIPGVAASSRTKSLARAEWP